MAQKVHHVTIVLEKGQPPRLQSEEPLPPGTYSADLQAADASDFRSIKDAQLSFLQSLVPYKGPISEDFSTRREDIYGDDGR